MHSLAAVAVVLTAFPANPAQSVLALSSLLNLPFETTAHSLSATRSSPGTSPKHAHAHLLGWAGKISDVIGGPWLGIHHVRAGEQASFYQGSAGFPQRSPWSLSAKARPRSSGTTRPRKTLMFVPSGLKPLVSLPITD